MLTNPDPLSHLETRRLTMRPLSEDDRPMLLRISGDPDSVKYLYFWGLNGLTPEEDAERFLRHARKNWGRQPVRAREYCALLRETGQKIGNGSVEWVKDLPGVAEIGWILLPEYRGQGYATEMGRELMRAAFEEMGANRVIAHCDARNLPSARVMLRLKMHLDETAPEARPAKRPGEKKGDECTYGILRPEWLVQRALAEYHTYRCDFDGFLPLPAMTDGTISLLCEKESPADPGRGRVPAYHFAVLLHGEKIGMVNLRIGYPDSLFYSGQIGYAIDPPWRGRGYAGAACLLLRPLLRAHDMPAALITNDVNNPASRRVCEKIGARFLCRAPLPENHELYQEGQRAVNIYALDAQETA